MHPVTQWRKLWWSKREFQGLAICTPWVWLGLCLSRRQLSSWHAQHWQHLLAEFRQGFSDRRRGYVPTFEELINAMHEGPTRHHTALRTWFKRREFPAKKKKNAGELTFFITVPARHFQRLAGPRERKRSWEDATSPFNMFFPSALSKHWALPQDAAAAHLGEHLQGGWINCAPVGFVAPVVPRPSSKALSLGQGGGVAPLSLVWFSTMTSKIEIYVDVVCIKKNINLVWLVLANVHWPMLVVYYIKQILEWICLCTSHHWKTFQYRVHLLDNAFFDQIVYFSIYFPFWGFTVSWKIELIILFTFLLAILSKSMHIEYSPWS